MDEQPHYLRVSFPGCQVQRITAFRVSHVGQRVVPQKNLDHIPKRQKSTMSCRTHKSFLPTALHVCVAWSPFTERSSPGSHLYLSLSPDSSFQFPDYLCSCWQAVESSWTTPHWLFTFWFRCFLENPFIFHYLEKVWFPCLWCWNSIQGQYLYKSSHAKQISLFTTLFKTFGERGAGNKTGRTGLEWLQT